MAGMGKVRKNKGKAKKPKARKQPGGGLWRAVAWIFGKSLKWGAVVAVWSVIALAVLAAWYATELPDVDRAFNATRTPTVPLLAADGTEFRTIGGVPCGPRSPGRLPSRPPVAGRPAADHVPKNGQRPSGRHARRLHRQERVGQEREYRRESKGDTRRIEERDRELGREQILHSPELSVRVGVERDKAI